jgi:actin-related protein
MSFPTSANGKSSANFHSKSFLTLLLSYAVWFGGSLLASLVSSHAFFVTFFQS